MPAIPADASTAIVIVVLVVVLVVVLFIVRWARKSRSADAAGVAATTADARETVTADAGAAAGPDAGASTTDEAAVGEAQPKTVLDYIDDRTIVLDVDDADRDAVIRRLARLMAATGRVVDEDAVVRAALERELISTTGIGDGIAIPHATTDAATCPVLAFARSRNGVDWNSLDEAPAHLIFMIAVPESGAGTEHLRVLAQLSRSLMKPSFRASIEMAVTPADVLAALAATVRPTGSAPL
ncbi:PTS sugar transporter subunit IIA [Cryobacterium arcticum]|uniref:PTS fructose transporter subunit IIC n=1 Tax=Cryobacterium arcticum TaxID=670052 RepID=A0A1B1BP22_9MICO|nr:fructose PTS transporter subunit IIA [Cryobacterium arcticum]ANP74241.1 PTS fructose transporter subunit IIC [Cryobacterium arcticum]